MLNVECFPQLSRGGFQQPIRILQSVRREPVEIIAQQQREVLELERQAGGVARVVRQFQQVVGREPLALEFAQGAAEFLRKTGEPRAGPE